MNALSIDQLQHHCAYCLDLEIHAPNYTIGIIQKEIELWYKKGFCIDKISQMATLSPNIEQHIKTVHPKLYVALRSKNSDYQGSLYSRKIAYIRQRTDTISPLIAQCDGCSRNACTFHTNGFLFDPCKKCKCQRSVCGWCQEIIRIKSGTKDALNFCPECYIDNKKWLSKPVISDNENSLEQKKTNERIIVKCIDALIECKRCFTPIKGTTKKCEKCYCNELCIGCHSAKFVCTECSINVNHISKILPDLSALFLTLRHKGFPKQSAPDEHSNDE